MRRCKITVLDCRECPEIVHKYLPGMPVIPCHVHHKGEVFITDGPFGTEIPVGFCANAWESISDEAFVIASGGRVHNSPDNHYVACCSDGARPVTFLLEPIIDDTQPGAMPTLDELAGKEG